MRYLYAFALAAPMILAPNMSHAQEKDFPTRPIEVVVNWGPGGGADIFARIMARQMESALNVSMPVVNVTGSAGNAGLARVASSTPDGYTIGTLTGVTVSGWAAGMGRLNVDDLEYIILPQLTPSMMFVSKDSPIKSYKELLDQAKANPEKVRIATVGYGSADDITIRYLEREGFPMINVPFSKPAQRYSAPLGGHVEALYEEPGDVVQYLDSGQLVPIVVFGKERHPDFPDVPASGEFGHDIGLPNWRALVAPPGTPEDRLRTLHEAAMKVGESKAWKDFCAKTFSCYESAKPDQIKAFIREQYEENRQAMQEYGMIGDKAKR